MNARKKATLFLIAFLSIVVGGYTILKVLHQTTEIEIIATQTNSTSTEEYLTPLATIPSQTATVEYRNLPADLREYFDPDHPPLEIPNSEQEGKAMLVINAIYAIDKDLVFLGGRLDFPNNGNAERSILLHSSDGGEHWIEVMQTTRVSEIEHIVFLGQGEGWALVAGTGERGASMPVMLWHTADFGETWRIAGKIHTGTGTPLVA